MGNWSDKLKGTLFVAQNKEGKLLKCEILLADAADETGICHIIYTARETNEAGKMKVYAALCNIGEGFKRYPIVKEEDWDDVEEALQGQPVEICREGLGTGKEKIGKEKIGKEPSRGKAEGPETKQADLNVAQMLNRAKGCNEAKDYTGEAKWLEAALATGLLRGNLAAVTKGDCGIAYYRAGNLEKAVPLLEEAGESGCEKAQVQCTMLYMSGEKIPTDMAKAQYWCEKAAGHGKASIQAMCAQNYYRGVGAEADYTKSLYWYEQAGEKNDADAQFQAGIMYYKGEGTAVDYNKAIEWFRKAADQGHETARKNVDVLQREILNSGLVPGQGRDVSGNDGTDSGRNKVFYAFDDNGKEVAYEVLFTFDDEKGTHYIIYTDNTDDKEGNTKAYAGVYDPRNAQLEPVKSRKAWKKIEGILEELQKEFDQAQSPEEAVNNFLRRQENQQPSVWRKLGQTIRKSRKNADRDVMEEARACRERGDLAGAFACYERAAQAGLVQAQVSCAHMYYCGEGCRINKTKALEKYRDAAENQDLEARFMCGVMFYRGEGCTADKEKARHWLETAAAAGHKEAKDWLESKPFVS